MCRKGTGGAGCVGGRPRPRCSAVLPPPLLGTWRRSSYPNAMHLSAAMACRALGGCTAVQAGRGLLRALSLGRRAAGCSIQPRSSLPRGATQPGQPAGRRHLSLSAAPSAPAAMEAALPPEIEHTVERIHCSPVRIVLYLGGGASQVGAAACPLAALPPSCGPHAPDPAAPKLPAALQAAWVADPSLLRRPCCCRRWRGCCRCRVHPALSWTCESPTAATA